MNTYVNPYQLSKEFHNTKYNFETGKLAFRADSAIFAQAGETTVLVTVTVDKNKSDSDFFPLTVEFVEKMYAGGKLSSNKFQKREKFPNDEAILRARAIDRSIRPMFPKEFKLPVQVIVTLLSYDDMNDPLTLAINAVSAALMQSSIPFAGPISAVRIGYIDDKLIVNPNVAMMTKSKLNLIFSGQQDGVSMIEVESSNVADEVMSEAFNLAVEEFKVWADFQNDFISGSHLKKEKIDYTSQKINFDIILQTLGISESELLQKLEDALFTSDDKVYAEKIDIIKKEIEEKNNSLEANEIEGMKFPIKGNMIDEVIYKYSRKVTRKGVLVENRRLSGRAMDEIRQLYIETGILPKVHGSALFTRGITQALSIVTLGSVRDSEISETFKGEEERFYMHHYSGPSYSLGEASRYSYNPGRREIGHGELAEKALKAVLPDVADFPYTIRVVSEVLSQSGSSSMASTCGSTLALMDAGVPIKMPVAGIAIGLMTNDDETEHKLVVDMADKEDFFGDMDFKVTGTNQGITAIQMDNKLGVVNVKILQEGLSLARNKLNELLAAIINVLPEPRGSLSVNAPLVHKLQINPERVGELIGPGGKNIKKITETSGAEIDIQDSGMLTITGKSKEVVMSALLQINNLVGQVEVGKIYDAVVDSIKPYGMFVNLPVGGESGLVHSSETMLNPGVRIDEMYKEGTTVKVMVTGRDDRGRLQLSIKRAL